MTGKIRAAGSPTLEPPGPSYAVQDLRESVSQKDSTGVGCLQACVLDEMRVGAGVESGGDGGECVVGVVAVVVVVVVRIVKYNPLPRWLNEKRSCPIPACAGWRQWVRNWATCCYSFTWSKQHAFLKSFRTEVGHSEMKELGS